MSAREWQITTVHPEECGQVFSLVHFAWSDLHNDRHTLLWVITTVIMVVIRREWEKRRMDEHDDR